jgi:hypothetical protein
VSEVTLRRARADEAAALNRMLPLMRVSIPQA